jgi:hypothetical protein
MTCCVPNSCYADVIYCEYSMRGDKAVLEHAYVDESGRPTGRFYTETYTLPSSFAEVAWYECQSCRQMFGDYEWPAVLEHFEPEEETYHDGHDKEDEDEA